MAQTYWGETHIETIKQYQLQLKNIPKTSRVKRIEVLSQMLVYIGKLAAELSEEYKQIYAEREKVYAEAEIAALKNKKEHAVLAVVQLRKEEATAYGNMKRWNNACESTKEEINALKYHVKVDIEDRSSRR